MSIDLGPLSGRSNARALSAALGAFAHSAADADEPLAAACCNFSILIATLDSTECMLEVVYFSELSVFLELLSVNVLPEPLQDQ